MSESDPVRQPATKTLLRGLSVLEAIAAHPQGLRTGEVAERTNLDRATVARLMTTLVQAGYLQSDGNRYSATDRISRLIADHPANSCLKTLARPFVEQLRRDSDEAIHLGVLQGGEIIFVDHIPSSQQVRAELPLTPSAAHLTAIGRAIMAFLPDQEQSAVLDRSLGLTGGMAAPLERSSIVDDLRITRKRGWATIDRHDDVLRVAAPIRDEHGHAFAGLSISGPAYRLADKLDALATSCQAAAARIDQSIKAARTVRPA